MSLLRRDRISRGGGVAVYYRDCLSCSVVYDSDNTLPDVMWCALQLSNGDRCIIGIIYRPPSATDSHNERLLQQIRNVYSSSRCPLLIMGDFNMPQLYVKTNHPSHSLEYKFQELIENLALHNHIWEHTRIREHNQSSLLDLVLTTEEFMVDEIVYEPPLGKSDHLVLLFDFICHADRTDDTSKLLRRINYQELTEKLHREPYRGTNNITLNGAWESFMEYLQSHIEACSTYITKKRANRKKGHLRSRTIKLARYRNSLWYEYKQASTAENWERFRVVRNRVTTLIKHDKEDYQFDWFRRWSTIRKCSTAW